MSQKPLKVMSYNILSGGEGRLNLISNVIKESNPDICGVLEAVDWQNNLEFYKNLANELGYTFFDLALANSKYNIAIISKIPLDTEHLNEGLRHTAMKVKIKEGAFMGIEIFFVHFSPKTEDDRLEELSVILQSANKLDKTIIMGDFNSLSPADPYDKEKLLKDFQEKNIIKYGTDQLRFDVIKATESAGFTDAWVYLKNTFDYSTPTPSNNDPHHADKIRIDYAFLSKNTLDFLSQVKILKNKDTDMASDHYPILIEIKP